MLSSGDDETFSAQYQQLIRQDSILSRGQNVCCNEKVILLASRLANKSCVEQNNLNVRIDRENILVYSLKECTSLLQIKAERKRLKLLEAKCQRLRMLSENVSLLLIHVANIEWQSEWDLITMISGIC